MPMAKVVNVVDYGAFLQVEGLSYDVLLHRNYMGKGVPVKKTYDVLEVGDIIDVTLFEQDNDTQRCQAKWEL